MHDKFTWQLLAQILLVSNLNGFSQTTHAPTEIYIIGTIHNGNKCIDHNTLYDILIQIKPDVILWEYHEDFETVFGLRTARFLKIANIGIEQLALQKYAKKHRHHMIYGFDTLIVNRKLYVKKRMQITDNLFGNLDTTKMEKKDSLIYAGYLQKSNFYYSFLLNSRLEDINKKDIIDSSRILYKWDREKILPLSRKYVTDSVLVQKYEAELDYWEARNEYMVKRIQEYIDKYPEKRFVILTGLNHKYFLTDGLLADKERIFVLKEIYGKEP